MVMSNDTTACQRNRWWEEKRVRGRDMRPDSFGEGKCMSFEDLGDKTLAKWTTVADEVSMHACQRL